MIRSLIASLQFLTRLPIPGQFEADELGRSINLFAVGGLVIGAAAGGVSYLLQRLGCPWTIRAVCITVFLAGVTGGMHLDGVADTFDGLMSGKRGEKLLEVMRDSRIGTMGAVALWAVLSLKAASIAAIPDPLTALLLACGAGRACLTGGLAFFPYAGGGLAAAFAPHAKKNWAGGVWLILLEVGLIFGSSSLAVFVALACAAGTAFCLDLRCQRLLGGITGDVLGASCETAEAVCLAVYALLS